MQNNQIRLIVIVVIIILALVSVFGIYNSFQGSNDFEKEQQEKYIDELIKEEVAKQLSETKEEEEEVVVEYIEEEEEEEAVEDDYEHYRLRKLMRRIDNIADNKSNRRFAVAINELRAEKENYKEAESIKQIERKIKEITEWKYEDRREMMERHDKIKKETGANLKTNIKTLKQKIRWSVRAEPFNQKKYNDYLSKAKKFGVYNEVASTLNEWKNKISVYYGIRKMIRAGRSDDEIIKKYYNTYILGEKIRGLRDLVSIIKKTLR